MSRSGVSGPNVWISDNHDGSASLVEAVEREIPKFWDYFYERHPKFASFKTEHGPIGWTPAFEAFDAMAETVTAYVRGFAK